MHWHLLNMNPPTQPHLPTKELEEKEEEKKGEERGGREGVGEKGEGERQNGNRHIQGSQLIQSMIQPMTI